MSESSVDMSFDKLEETTERRRKGEPLPGVPAAEAAESEGTLEENKALQVEQPLAAKEVEEIREVAIACGAVEPAEEVEAITRVQTTQATSTWQEIRSEIVEGRYTARSAVRARAAAELKKDIL